MGTGNLDWVITCSEMYHVPVLGLDDLPALIRAATAHGHFKTADDLEGYYEDMLTWRAGEFDLESNVYVEDAEFRAM